MRAHSDERRHPDESFLYGNDGRRDDFRERNRLHEDRYRERWKEQIEWVKIGDQKHLELQSRRKIKKDNFEADTGTAMRIP